jgi:peptidoglycan/xylan/chitin deacetylase (PgdA/CDA1 family)
MVGKAVNDLKRTLVRWALIIALAGTVAGICSAGAGDVQGERITPHILRYSPAPLNVRMPPPAAAVRPQVVFHGDRSRNRVALTFDACATKIASGYDEAVIRVLIETRTPATLFLGGKWMLEHPDQTRRLAAVDLFELGNHSFLHPHMTRIPDDHVRQELEWTQIVMYSLTGRQASLYRPPYGEQDERTGRIAADTGLITVQFDLASGDPDPGLSRERLVRSVATGARNGSIIVMHMNGRGWKTAEALPGIIGELRRKGFHLVTVGEMMREGREADGDRARPY